ncbi:MAG: hypothetical protein QM578_09365 [Pantoea sp.]|uniref:hypothetical protein n=1 Tax=Pantoea sp. TaxID=69393 RepID=UPI0039E4B2A2
MSNILENTIINELRERLQRGIMKPIHSGHLLEIASPEEITAALSSLERKGYILFSDHGPSRGANPFPLTDSMYYLR